MPPQTKRPSMPITEFDQKTIGNSTQMLKAIIPFLDIKEQKLFGIMIRAIELNMTMEFFSKNRLPSCTFGIRDSNDILSEIKNYCSPEEKQQFDMMMGMMKVQQMQNASSPMDMMSGFLSPEQMKMYKEFEKML